MKQVTAVLIGAGQRGMDTYATYALLHPDELRFIAVAEPNRERREEFQRTHELAADRCFAGWEELLALPKLADCALVCTQDRMHYLPVIKALSQGYDVLCEKPMSPDKAELTAMRTAAEQSGHILSVCHVLRYSPFFQHIKALLDKGAVGELISVQHSENVGYWHAAHSFVRGNWRSTSETSPMLLQKCCHDLDILYWLIGSRCVRVSSFGGLSHFDARHRPAGAPLRCTDGCPYRDDCPYYAPRFYLEHPRAVSDNFVLALSRDTGASAILEALKAGPYGRCVYACDNDVVDHQAVNLEYENGVTASMTMCAFTENCERVINLMGSKGQILGNMEENWVEVRDFATGHRTKTTLHIPKSGHNGSDSALMKSFVSLVAGQGENLSSAAASVESHLTALAAEESRIAGGMPIDLL